MISDCDLEKAAASLADSAYSTAISAAQTKLLEMALEAREDGDDDAVAALTSAAGEIGKLNYSGEIERYNLLLAESAATEPTEEQIAEAWRNFQERNSDENEAQRGIPMDLVNFPIEFEGQRYLATGKLTATPLDVEPIANPEDDEQEGGAA